MLHKIKRMSNYGDTPPRPCDGAVPDETLDSEGLAEKWYIELNEDFDIFALVQRLGERVIIRLDGEIVIYDDYNE